LPFFALFVDTKLECFSLKQALDEKKHDMLKINGFKGDLFMPYGLFRVITATKKRLCFLDISCNRALLSA
jgi:hypothetical protein